MIALCVSPAAAWTSDTHSHGIWELQQRLFELPELEYWLLNMTTKVIFNFHNNDLSMSGEITPLIWLFNYV